TPPSARTWCATWTRASYSEGPAVKLMRLICKSLFRHRLRSALTILGIATAVMAFGLIRTIVGAWNAGVTGAAANRMITRHRVSLIFPIPLPYRDEIARVPGVTGVSWANWFGGVYGEPNDFKNFWPRFAVDPDTYFDLYPEFQLPPDQLAAFKKEREFQQSFVQMSSAIITSLQVISVVIVGIILLVLANTIVMSVRERTREYAVLKTLGFSGRQLVAFVLGEALVISLSGGVLGLLLTFPIVKGFSTALPTFFPVINVAPLTIALGLGAALLAGLAAAAIPANRVVRTPIVIGLRTVG